MFSQIESPGLFMKRNSSPFKWRHYAPDVILLCVRLYCRFRLSYRDIEEMMRERGLEQDARLRDFENRGYMNDRRNCDDENLLV
jgi:hypothetical protein